MNVQRGIGQSEPGRKLEKTGQSGVSGIEQFGAVKVRERAGGHVIASHIT